MPRQFVFLWDLEGRSECRLPVRPRNIQPFSQEDDAGPETFRESIEHQWPECRDRCPDPELLSHRERGEGLRCGEPDNRQCECEQKIDIDGAKPLTWLALEPLVAGLAPHMESKRRLEEMSVTAARASELEPS